MRKTIASSDELDNLPVDTKIKASPYLGDVVSLIYIKYKEGWVYKGFIEPDVYPSGVEFRSSKMMMESFQVVEVL